jgi:hypothetical protein
MMNSYTFRSGNKNVDTERQFYQTFTNGKKFGRVSNKHFNRQIMAMSMTQEGGLKWNKKMKEPIIFKSLNKKDNNNLIRMTKPHLLIDSNFIRTDHNKEFSKTSREKFVIRYSNNNVNITNNMNGRYRHNVSAGGNRQIKNKLTLDIN